MRDSQMQPVSHASTWMCVNSNAPLVSAIIPAFNCAQYVAQAIESVLAQTYAGPIELIVVNDGSTDDLESELQPYRSRIRYVAQQNRGIGGGRNGGIAIARGDYIAFLDADDYWLPQRLTKMVALARQLPGALVLTDLQIFNMRNNKLMPRGYCASQGLLPLFDLDARSQYERLLEGNFLNYMFMVPRAFFNRVGLFDESLQAAEDLDFELRCLSAGIPVRIVPEALAVYRRFRPGATTTQRNANMAESLVSVLSKHRTQLRRQRWALAVGERDKIRLRLALESKTYFDAFALATKLVTNTLYMRHFMQRRWESMRIRGKQNPVAA